MSIKKELFGKMPCGCEVYKYILTNSKGSFVEIINYGGALVSINVPDRNGKLGDIICGYDTLDEYLRGDQHQGALVGRFANRIKAGKFTLNGKEYVLATNDNGVNHLHGGTRGYGLRAWNSSCEEGQGCDYVTMTISSPDGDEGYPGNLELKVVYTFDDDDRLTIDYEAVCDANTVANFTNHAYFNLAGYASCDVKGHIARIAADYITETDDELIPTGTLMPVDGTMYDLRTPRMLEGEYDDNFVLNASGEDFDEPRLICEVSEPTSGRAVRVLTTMPGIQLYTGNMMEGGIPFKGGVPSARHSAFCLETQRWPDSPNHDNFTDCTLHAGERFTSRTVYEFISG